MTPRQSAARRVRAEAEGMLTPGRRFAVVTDAQMAGEQPETGKRPPVLIGVATHDGSLVIAVDAVEYDALRVLEIVKAHSKEP